MTQTAPTPAARSALDDTQVLAADPTTELPLMPRPDDSRRSRLLDLSLTQIVGGSMAAATAAALGSRLGLLGTITGAAIGSVVTAVAANLYTNSMARAREAVVLARAYSRGTVESRRPEWWRVPDRSGARRLLATTGALFAVAAVVLLGVQLTTGAQVTGTTIGRSAAAAPVVEAPSGSNGAGASGTTGGSEASRAGAVTPTPARSTTGTPAPAATTDAPVSGGAGGTATSTGSATGTSTPGASSTGTTNPPVGADQQTPSTGTLPVNPPATR